MRCPFVGEEGHDREDPEEGPPVAVPKSPKVPPLVVAGKAKAKEAVDAGKAALLAEAEDIVSRAAEAIPAMAERTIADLLRERGPLAVGVGAAAGVAIRAVAKGFAGGGFHFPQVFDPRVAIRAR